jgi:polycystin 1L2
MKIWHDNSGKGENASWFLKNIIVYDLQTKEKFYSICDNWLAVEKGDGKIEKNLIFVQKSEFKEINRKNEIFIEIFSDFHLWYSVFKKPIGSLFTRFNRVTCCFLSVYFSTLLNTIFYSSKYVKSTSSVLLHLTLFELTQEHVKIFF